MVLIPNTDAGYGSVAFPMSQYLRRTAFRDFPRELLIGVAELHEIVASGDNAEIEALLCNPSLSSKILEELYQRAGAFAFVTEERWCDLIYMSRKNARIGTEED